MNAEARTRCMRRMWLRHLIAFAPPLIVGWMAWQGQTQGAVLLFTLALGIIMTGTLVPRCSWFGRMIKQLAPAGNQVLLTIDDGPHPQHTPAILDILDQHRIKAVFFLIGERAAQHPHLVREIVARGHEIGNHTQTHPASTFWVLRPAALWREIATCQQTLTAICPEHPPRFFRPPAGHHNVFTSLIVETLGLQMMMWSARGFDGVVQQVPLISRLIARRLQPGAIVLIHEGTDVAIEVAQTVASMLAASSLKCDTPPASLALGHDEMIVERRAAP